VIIDVHNFHRLVHDNRRQPIWIKNDVALLWSEAYPELTGQQRAVLDGLWLLEAERCSDSPRRPIRWPDLSRHLGLVVRRDLEALEGFGFIEISSTRTKEPAT
jgi:hypothetical protein